METSKIKSTWRVCEERNHYDSRMSAMNEQKFKKNNKRYRILLVEDQPIVRKLNLALLEKLGFTVDVACTGHEALALYKNGYDIILLDIGLPDIDGVTVCSTIREKIRKTDLPIIAVTAHGMTIEHLCLAAGINEVVSKPVTLEQLREIIYRWLEISEK